MIPLIWVGLGGLLGSVGRFLMGQALTQSSGIPYPTLAINLTGALLIGGFLSSGVSRPDNSWFYFLIPGMLGGFTTYSAFSGETFFLLRNSQFKEALLYVFLTFFGGLLATSLGFWIGRTIILR
jgi:fluoride exporter